MKIRAHKAEAKVERGHYGLAISEMSNRGSKPLPMPSNTKMERKNITYKAE